MNDNSDNPNGFVRYINTILLSVIIMAGGGFSTFIGSRSIAQGEMLAAIRASQVTRAEIETKLNALQIEAAARWAGVTNEQIALRAKLAEIEVRQAAVAAALMLKETKANP